jgi:hypothetical protein
MKLLTVMYKHLIERIYELLMNHEFVVLACTNPWHVILVLSKKD